MRCGCAQKSTRLKGDNMPRTPHYIPGVTRMKKCTDCGEWLPITEFQKNGKNRFGTEMRRPFCKACYKVLREDRYKRTGRASTCTNCPELETCYQILWDLVPLPCQDENFAMPQSAGWVEVES